METFHTTELKAVIIPENFLENPMNVLKENCLTVQHFEYHSEHKRNNSGSLFGATKPVVLKFTVRVNSPHHARDFYQRLLQNGHYSFSFLFNATFNNNQRLAEYEDGLVADGYGVGVEENFRTKGSEQGVDEQMMLDVQLLVCSMTYLGRENHYTNVFIQ